MGSDGQPPQCAARPGEGSGAPGRAALPGRLDNHFVVDPDKFDFYAMDCYRIIGDDNLAEMHDREIIRKTTNADGMLSTPCATQKLG